ncbi:MAG: TIGR03862 family flavoprotein [Rhodoferax sp.]
MNSELPIVVIGAGPAGLMAAQTLLDAGLAVHLYDAMPSVGRKFLLAGKGGLNLTHSEPAEVFVGRYGKRRAVMEYILRGFGPEELRAWCQGLGIGTFVGSSGRVFPTDMKAAPLLRAWLQRLRHPGRGPGVQFHMRHRWTGWDASAQALCFETPQGVQQVRPRATLLALGGGSWARLGSDGTWVARLLARGIEVAPLLPANCGFDVRNGWSAHFRERHAGQPFKSVAIALTDSHGVEFSRRGEFVATASGVEGSLVYAASSLLRDDILAHGSATLRLDLLPDLTLERVQAEVGHPRGRRSLSNHLQSRLKLDGIKRDLLYELLSREQLADPQQLAQAIKALPIVLTAMRPIDEAISSAGGVRFEGLTPGLMAVASPGLFFAGEMLDWEAPTGGYLMTACLATGRRAAQGLIAWLR